MTYLNYIGQLVNELRSKKAETLCMYDAILNTKGYLTTLETTDYFQRINDCHALANQVEQIMLGVLDGSISASDPID
jgi:hypothetical protein